VFLKLNFGTALSLALSNSTIEVHIKLVNNVVSSSERII